MKIGLVHPDSPTSEGSGAVHSATLIGETLKSRGHELVFICPGEVDNDYDTIPTIDLDIKKNGVKNKYKKINEELIKIKDKLTSYDILHSYLMRTIPSVGEISEYNDNISTVVSLNAFGAVCPKNDLLYKNDKECDSNGPIRCTKCIYSSKRDMPPKPDHGQIYYEGRVIHHTVKNLKNYLIVSEIKNNLDKIDMYQALSSHVKNRYVGFDFPDNYIQVIPNLLDDRFLEPHQSSFSDPIKLLYVGGLKKHKGADRLPGIIDGLKSADDREYMLSIIGKGPLEPQLRSEIHSRELDNVELLGFKSYSELPNIYSSSDLFLYPGRWQEPFGRVFIEALAAGTPVVATDVGAASEIIGSGGRITQNSSRKLIDEISNIDQRDFENLSTNAVKEAKKFKKEKVVSNIESMYQNLI